MEEIQLLGKVFSFFFILVQLFSNSVEKDQFRKDIKMKDFWKLIGSKIFILCGLSGRDLNGVFSLYIGFFNPFPNPTQNQKINQNLKQSLDWFL
jgi:hypothetical protein